MYAGVWEVRRSVCGLRVIDSGHGATVLSLSLAFEFSPANLMRAVHGAVRLVVSVATNATHLPLLLRFETQLAVCSPASCDTHDGMLYLGITIL